MFSVYGCMLCLVHYIFVINTSVQDCLGRFVPEMTYCVLSGTLNFAKFKLYLLVVHTFFSVSISVLVCVVEV